MLTDKQQKAAAAEFAANWEGKGYEKGESQPFWLDLLTNVFGIEHAAQFISFENQVKLSNTSFIDGFIDKTHVLIEQKSLDKDLLKPIKQSDGSSLTPYQQAKRYASELPYSKRPRWVVVSNFKSFLVYDMENPSGEPEEILLKDLAKDYKRLQFLVDDHNAKIKKELEVSVKAGDLVGLIYDSLLKEYINPESPETLKSLNVLCVRIVFCMYAEDAGIFGKPNMFHDYLAPIESSKIRKSLIELFRVLNTPYDKRDPYMEAELSSFPYVNGGLFANENIEIPNFTEDLKTTLLSKASDDFDWSEISPTIFGAIFESTLNPETRRQGGMHYTSIENIHKVIDPLFLNDLKDEFKTILNTKATRPRKQKLSEFREKLARLRFLDPACGSGNFLTETYLSLRRLENEAIKEEFDFKAMLGDFSNPIKVGIHQFYGIEINDFAVTVAKTALWIAESQMMAETEKIVQRDLDFLPLKNYSHIVEGNALHLDWAQVIAPSELNYIIGNPPFLGARVMSKEQKQDLLNLFGKYWKNAGNLDYVSGWYKKTFDLIKGTSIQAALVSTNSICQGESVANLWQPLMTSGLCINFAHRTFQWDSEANIKAHVHCIIVGFSDDEAAKANKFIFDQGVVNEVKHINAYLIDASDTFVESTNKPLCNVPRIGIGNKPIDDGNYLFSKEEMDDFVAKEPLSQEFFKPWYGTQEFINNKPRYCLWLGECSPAQLRKMPLCLERVNSVRNFRLQSTSESTRKIAEKPTRFHVENMPKDDYILIPKLTPESRLWIPMGFLSPDVLCSDLVQIIPKGTIYHFGILTSSLHLAWIKTVCGRFGNSYRYSGKVVYNNFPWPEPTEGQKAKIEKTAQGILDARALYPDSSLADLYDDTVMPIELRKAHLANDKAVLEAYGFPTKDFSESDIVAKLFEMYEALIKKEQDVAKEKPQKAKRTRKAKD
ncbi:methylase [Anaerobiospirillum sp. NML120448]|uniref:DNA methyltransferase n=1 Tax=Anaerobiospirillum sp. NML120448 TaxID=2932816 RepID=UPI001FF3E895|nr:DNA methyltransferase [Anaerobiospirillum sp. NML120448]MCK0513790.1 methylase [Anaerobiospirillum sp. NML120448]